MFGHMEIGTRALIKDGIHQSTEALNVDDVDDGNMEGFAAKRFGAIWRLKSQLRMDIISGF